MSGPDRASDATSAPPPPLLPEYLLRTYRWAYLSRRTLPWLDRDLVVSAILWGNAGRLMRAACAEFAVGSKVLQAACVYGRFSPMLAARIGPQGRLDVADVSRLQLENARRKLASFAHTHVLHADLAHPLAERYDGVCAFFLLHEVPTHQRRLIVDNLLAAVAPGGKAVFVDYHRPARWHPLRPVMHLVFRWLEPYAPSLLETPIESLSARAGEFEWRRITLFGGLYQHVVAVRCR
ncbi:rhodoquinone biosynthesis methyltransferase RquA [Pseudothauera rhizosphaerae]|uniref:Class I SAM-dependent methyltransferase n=1 Tax=Pseudothauera rhizosphaerae TaxID=2565932 RepID=A0A4S4AU04_9RHOO|nr:rhodoquinone biosynthesis methyltransferase RquA [Pseudothauera rhizosphaerae]THF63401.1 class I SAM-dependent methyltransferase [Pseudothauera rhizosphaerae]